MLKCCCAQEAVSATLEKLPREGQDRARRVLQVIHELRVQGSANKDASSEVCTTICSLQVFPCWHQSRPHDTGKFLAKQHHGVICPARGVPYP
jgi:hypothetical protein